MLILEHRRKILSDLSRQSLSFCLMSVLVAVQGACDPECITDFVGKTESTSFELICV